MNVNKYIAGLQKRNISFRIVQGELKHFNMKSGRGWDELIENYSNDKSPSTLSIFKEIYDNQLLYGKRAIFFSQVNDPNDSLLITNILLNSINTKDKDYTEYMKTYPFPIANNKHGKVKKLRPVCVETKTTSDYVILIISYLRPFKERTIIEPSSFSGKLQKELQKFDEVIGVTDRYIQCFDTIVFNKINGELRFEIDMSTNLNFQELDRASTRYRRLLMLMFYKSTKYHLLITRNNIFHTINNLYSSADGTILKLGHATGTGSIKEESMRRKRTDLRQEAYHQAGLAAIGGKTNNYSISKQWPGCHQNILTIHIPGHFSLVSASTPFINHGIFEGCVDKSDYDLLISKAI
ncbi:hypothetical protein [Siccibacter turicensis]|uniref:hypothetical protein n=1 Tax=Siccibacter turicensis TaxID=357233 RepID=UPI0023F2DD41|nr:hypothetical protein [Siccibacter turicensis]